MEWELIVNLIDPSLLVVVAVCWVLGFIIKQTPNVPNWSIVYIVSAFAITAVLLLQGLSVEAVLQGILCGAVAVYGHQLVTQAKKSGDA